MRHAGESRLIRSSSLSNLLLLLLLLMTPRLLDLFLLLGISFLSFFDFEKRWSRNGKFWNLYNHTLTHTPTHTLSLYEIKKKFTNKRSHPHSLTYHTHTFFYTTTKTQQPHTHITLSSAIRSRYLNVHKNSKIQTAVGTFSNFSKNLPNTPLFTHTYIHNYLSLPNNQPINHSLFH